MPKRYTLSDLCRLVGQDALAVTTIQKGLQLPVPEKGYSGSYMRMVKKVAALRSFRVSMDKISELLETEKKILKLLHIASEQDSHTRYTEGCKGTKAESGSPKRSLLLTGFDLGFNIDSDVMQQHLDFEKRETELFAGQEMGEDVRRLVGKYKHMLKSIKKQINAELPSLTQAIKWGKNTLRS